MRSFWAELRKMQAAFPETEGRPCPLCITAMLRGALVITGQGNGEQVFPWGQLRDGTHPKATNGRIHCNIWLCARPGEGGITDSL